MADGIDDLRRRIQARQVLPSGACCICSKATGKIAPHYARLDLPEFGIVIHLPVCQTCAGKYVEMARAEQMELKLSAPTAHNAKSSELK